MTLLREKILRRMQSNHRFYAHFVDFKMMNNISKETTNDVLNLVEQSIDEWVREADNDEEVEACADSIKELLK